MAEKFISLVTALALMVCASGCASVFEREYNYSEPYGENDRLPEGNAQEIHNKSMLLGAIVALIDQHEEFGQFRFSNYNGSPSDDLAAVCYEIKTVNSLGAFAVDNISYDTSRIVSYYTAEVQISYKRSLEEIESIITIGSSAEIGDNIYSCLKSFKDRLLLRVNSTMMDEEYFLNMVESYYLSDPMSSVLRPSVSVAAYPNEGRNHIFQIDFKYAADARTLIRMRGETKVAIDNIKSSISADSDAEKALELARSLSLLCICGDGAGEYPDSVYGAMVERCGSSQAVSLAYRVLCQEMGIECECVVGMDTFSGGSEHWWNIITVDGENYHADISAFAENPGSSFLLTDEMLWGSYIWDTDVYPACTGSLRYGDLVELPEEASADEDEGATGEAPEEPPEEHEEYIFPENPKENEINP